MEDDEMALRRLEGRVCAEGPSVDRMASRIFWVVPEGVVVVRG